VSSSLFIASRTVSVGSPAIPSLLGSSALEFKSLDGTEALGELFEYTVRLQTPDSPMLTGYVTANVPVKQLVGKEFGIRIALDGKGFGTSRRARAPAPARSTAWSPAHASCSTRTAGASTKSCCGPG
jgi:hypothetical protein